MTAIPVMRDESGCSRDFEIAQGALSGNIHAISKSRLQNGNCCRGTRFTGLLFPLWLALYSGGSFALGFLRADEVPLVAGWRADQLTDLALALIAVAALLTGLLKTGDVEEA
jgi:hypothetical protein